MNVKLLAFCLGDGSIDIDYLLDIVLHKRNILSENRMR